MRERFSNLFKLTMLAMMMLVFTLLSSSSNVSAATVWGVSGLKQEAAGKDFVAASWKVADNATYYNVYYRTQEEGIEKNVLFATVNTTSCTVTGLQPGEQYRIRIVPGNENGEAKTMYQEITMETVVDTLDGLKQDRFWIDYKTVDVSWATSNSADGYELVLYDDKNKKVTSVTKPHVATSEKRNKVSLKNVKTKVYTLKARSYTEFGGQKYYSSWSSIKCLGQAKVTSVKVSGNKLNVKWGKVSGATGYNIYVSTSDSKKSFKKVATVKSKSSSYTVKKLKGKSFNSKKNYYVYVQTVYSKKSTKASSDAFFCWNSKKGRLVKMD